MMNSATARVSFAVRILLLMVCCALLMPAHAPAGEKNHELESFRVASLTLAISGIGLLIYRRICAVHARREEKKHREENEDG